MLETFRGAIMAVEKGQIGKWGAFGMKSFQLFRLGHFSFNGTPRYGQLCKQLAGIDKIYSPCSIIGLEDVVRKSSMVGSATKQPFTFLFTAALVYVFITGISLAIMKFLEKKYQVAE